MDKKIDVKIGTKEEAKWTKIKKRAEDAVDNCLTEIEINERIIQLAEEKISYEKEHN